MLHTRTCDMTCNCTHILTSTKHDKLVVYMHYVMPRAVRQL